VRAGDPDRGQRLGRLTVHACGQAAEHAARPLDHAQRHPEPVGAVAGTAVAGTGVAGTGEHVRARGVGEHRDRAGLDRGRRELRAVHLAAG
jgi:hypothetical protein